MSSKLNVSIFSGRASRYLAEKIAVSFGIPLGESIVTEFSDGEFQTSFEDNIRGHHVFIIQSTFPPADNFMELLMMIDAAKRASARKINAVIPYFGYGRQDRKDKPRVSIAAKMNADLLTSVGIDLVITLDLHADQIQGFFNVPVDHLFASNIFVPYIRKLNIPDLILASPDTGGTRRAANYAKALNTGFVISYKHRAKPNVVDDIIDTAGTITRAAEVIMNEGAKSVRAFCTHPIFSGEAYGRIAESPFVEVLVTDTIPLKEKCDKITVLSTADLFAEVIRRVQNHKSISSLFKISKL